MTTQASTFASPGYGGAELSTEDRIMNLWIKGDSIRIASKTADNEGDHNMIFHEHQDEDYLHSMELHKSYVEFLHAHGIGRPELMNRALHGIDYDKIYIDAVSTNAGNTKFNVGYGSNDMKGSRKADIMLGGHGEDRLEGRGGRDHIDGGKHDDTLLGGAAGDFIFGGANDDDIDGQAGADQLTGGAGNDTFIFSSHKHIGKWASYTDVITDFVSTGSAPDYIDLSAIDANSENRGNQAFAFIGKNPFSGTPGELRYDVNKGKALLRGDRDGDGEFDFTIVLEGVDVLEQNDFIL